MNEVEAALLESIFPWPRTAPATFLLAVSGGADSLALLLAGARLQARMPERFRFHVASVDHGLRPEAASEASFVASVANTAGLTQQTLRWDGGGTQPGNLSHQAREARYDLLIEEARRVGALAVITAHHHDDQLETILMAQRRGAAGAALAGMRIWRDLAPGLLLLRPFLDSNRATLQAAVEEAGLRAVDDPTNHDPHYLRARVRMELAADDALRRALEQQRRAAEALRIAADHETGANLFGLVSRGRLSVTDAGEAFVCDPESLSDALLSRILTGVGGGAYPPAADAVARLRQGLRGGLAAATLNGCALRMSGRKIRFFREYGRNGLPADAARGPKLQVFDRRFDIRFDAPKNGARLVAFGSLGRGSILERTLPIVLAEDHAPIAAHPALAAKLPTLPSLDAHERVGWRMAANLRNSGGMPLTSRLQIAANAPEAVGKDLADTYLRWNRLGPCQTSSSGTKAQSQDG